MSDPQRVCSYTAVIIHGQTPPKRYEIQIDPDDTVTIRDETGTELLVGKWLGSEGVYWPKHGPRANRGADTYGQDFLEHINDEIRNKPWSMWTKTDTVAKKKRHCAYAASFDHSGKTYYLGLTPNNSVRLRALRTLFTGEWNGRRVLWSEHQHLVLGQKLATQQAAEHQGRATQAELLAAVDKWIPELIANCGGPTDENRTE